MKANLNEVEINGDVYVKKGSGQTPAKKRDGMTYCIVRSRDAGVFAGYVDMDNIPAGSSARVVHDARRIWYWSGAATLSQLAIDGTKEPEECKFPPAVDLIEVLGVCEVIPCTEKARKSIEGVREWRA